MSCQNFLLYQRHACLQGEINKILELGVDPRRIIFANPAKPASHIRYAAALGVDIMTFDNECELHKIKSLFPAAKYV
jgi:ornithine decarboxylase